jgi:hypothetical protein
MNGSAAPHSSLTRRNILKAGAAIAIAGPQLRGAPAEAQTPKRGGTLRFTFQSDPVTGFGLRGAWADPEAYFYRVFVPEQWGSPPSRWEFCSPS